MGRVLWVELSSNMTDEDVKNFVHDVLAAEGVEVVHEMEEEEAIEPLSDDQCLSLLRPTLQ